MRQDMQDLHKLGYAQQLFREMGGFSNFSISFSIISILTGAILLFGYGLQFAGPAINTFGWPLVSFFTLCVAASMAELASAYPTAGGLYFWAHRLGGKNWAWVTAWFNMIGQITITAGIDYAVAINFMGLVNRIAGTSFSVDSVSVLVPVMILIMIPQVLINVFGIRLTAKLNDISTYWHIAGVIIIAALLTIFGHSRPASFLFETITTTTPESQASTFALGNLKIDSIMMHIPGMQSLYVYGGIAFAFVLGLLQAQWTYTGYDASAHVAEETVMARLNSAWGVFLSVLISAVVGYILLLILTLHIPDIAATILPENGPPVFYIIYSNMNAFFGNICAVLIVGAMWLCGLSSITSMSRMWFAFARDGGMPGHRWIRRIHPKYRTPVWSIVITSVLAVLLTIYAALYQVVVALSTASLYIAYALPIFLNLRNKIKKTGEFTTPESAPWSLRGAGIPLNIIALLWVGFITLLFSIPPNELAGWSLLLLCAFMLIYWLAHAKKHFTGPKPADETELRKIEAAMKSEK